MSFRLSIPVIERGHFDKIYEVTQISGVKDDLSQRYEVDELEDKALRTREEVLF